MGLFGFIKNAIDKKIEKDFLLAQVQTPDGVVRDIYDSEDPEQVRHEENGACVFYNIDDIKNVPTYYEVISARGRARTEAMFEDYQRKMLQRRREQSGRPY